jgi:hypothetical protein
VKDLVAACLTVVASVAIVAISAIAVKWGAAPAALAEIWSAAAVEYAPDYELLGLAALFRHCDGGTTYELSSWAT